MKSLRRPLCLALALILFATPLSPVAANPTEEVAQLRAMLDEQDALDVNGAASKDRQLAREWLQEAEVLVANRKQEAAKKRLRRVEFAVELITALVAAAIIRQKAEEQEAYAYTAPEQQETLQLEVENLRKRKTELQAELQKYRATVDP